MLDWGVTEWLIAAGLVSGAAALVALLKDGASLFRSRAAPTDAVREEIERAESRRAEMLKAAGLAVGGVAIAEALHHRHTGDGGGDRAPADKGDGADSMEAAAEGDSADAAGEAGQWAENLRDFLDP